MPLYYVTFTYGDQYALKNTLSWVTPSVICYMLDG